MEDREDRIRNRAYELWLLEGMPEGRDVDHWFMAAETIRIEDLEQSCGNPNPSYEVIRGYLAPSARQARNSAPSRNTFDAHRAEPGSVRLAGEAIPQTPDRDERARGTANHPRLVALHRSGSGYRQNKNQIRH